MKLVLSIILVVIAIVVPGVSTTFSQEIGNVQFLGQFVPPIGGSYVAGCWGWTDTTTGREYALLGSYGGTSIVEITDPGAMVERDFIPGASSTWHEIQTYGKYAYVVSEGGFGTQIIDLSYLPDSAHLVKNFIYTSSGRSTQWAHSIHIMDGYMYLNGCSNWSPGGIVIFSLADPINPLFRSAYTRNYIHDSYAHGDTLYGAAINGQGIDIIDISVKTSPVYRRSITYPGAGTHNIATTVDGKYVLSTDEIGSTAKTLKIWDMQVAPPTPMVAEYVGSPTAIVHNVFVKGNLAIMSYYTAGIRVVDITDPTTPVEVGGYDTYPGDPSAYDGAWSVYPYFPSGKIIIGDMSSGLYVVEANLNGPKVPTSFVGQSDYQTPTSAMVTWVDPTELVSGAPLSNFTLNVYRNNTLIANVDSGVQTYTDTGLVKHQYYTYSIRAVTATESSAVRSSSIYSGGHPQAKAPTSFKAIDGTDGSHLSWTNPSRQLDNTPLNDLSYVLIYRDGVRIDSIAQTSSDTGQFRTYLDTTEGYHSYYLQVRDNESPTYYSPATSTVTSYGKLKTNFVENFDGTLPPFLSTGTWGTSNLFSTSGANSFADSPYDYYPNSSSSYVIMPPVVLGTNPMLQFKHIAIIAFADFGFLEISKNRRETWSSPLRVYNWAQHPEWADGMADATDWFTETWDLSTYAGDTVNVRFRLVSNNTIQADGWYIDDIVIGSAQQSGSRTKNTVSGWNMLSLPLKVTNGLADTVFPGASSEAFRYNTGYATTESLKFGQGYWIKFDSAASFALTGSTTLRDTFDVVAKWNMIGVISDSVDTAKVKSIPAGIIKSPYYEFNGGYTIVKKLVPGKAYWVKTSQAGRITQSAFTNKSIVIDHGAPSPEETMNTLSFTDAAGHSQKLYFGNGNRGGFDIDRFELPPVPPAGAFDIRFASQRNLEVASSEASEHPITMQSVAYPFTIRWEMQERSQSSAILTIGSRTIAMKVNGSVTVDQPGELIALRLLSSEAQEVLPTEFALHQNYPNPFNPFTTITYELPRVSVVTLRVFNVLGEEVTTLVNREEEAGIHTIRWDASNLPSGVYYYRIAAGNHDRQAFTETKKLLLAR